MSFLSKIGGFVSKAADWAGKIANFVSNPIGSITKAVSPLIDKVATKLPFGLGKIAAPFAKKFLAKGLDWVSSGPLAGVFGLLDRISPTVSKLAGFVKSLDGLLNGGLKSLPAEARENAANIVARQHARAVAA